MRDVLIDLASDISIFVGANNSGKTSATQAVKTFVSGNKEKISLHDFSSYIWKELNDIADDQEPHTVNFPSMSIDLWFHVNQEALHLVIPLLPSTAWQGTEMGVRIEFGPKNPAELITKYRGVCAEAERQRSLLREPGDYQPWPKCLTDFLLKELKNEYEFKYYVLDRTLFTSDYRQQEGYAPALVTGGAAIVQSIIKVDILNAQRHLADSSDPSSGGGRSEDLSKRLSKFYKRNLAQMQDDHTALKALSESENSLNEHLESVFKETIKRLGSLGYRGLKNPKILIKSALNPTTVLTQDARVHYKVGDGDNAVDLPDTYNGLGLKNLIYMVVEVLDLQENWKAEENARPPLHLIFIEEPEAHLHTQLQQVFIRNILDLLAIQGDDPNFFSSQMVITTHSPHVLYERGFLPIRYFRRHVEETTGLLTTDVLNLSTYYTDHVKDSEFLQRYLKLTHCDLFFADAAILVEGNVERLLIPAMIEMTTEGLQSACICILEVGGAFGHKFKSLIEFLGITALVITDIDSVSLVATTATPAATPIDEENFDEVTDFEYPQDIAEEANGQSAAEEENVGGENPTQSPPPVKLKGKACQTSTPDAYTSNQTLIQWLPKKRTIADLWQATAAEKTHSLSAAIGTVRVAYQTPVAITYNGQTRQLCGRTLEEMFGLENFAWVQADRNESLGLKLRTTPSDLSALAKAMFNKVKGSGFDKTRFAIGVLTSSPEQWSVPSYIAEGLKWLESEIDIEEDLPAEVVAQTANDP